jgi:hypothetical protein
MEGGGGGMKHMKVSARCGVGEAFITVPMEFFQPHEPQALINHSLNLRQLSEREGLSPQEAVAIIEGKDWSEVIQMDTDEAWETLNAAISQWEQSNETGT